MLRAVRPFHHCQLRACVQAVKEEMRVDLCLKEFELRLLEMRLHG
jgi:hypothetical protein